MDEWLGSNLNGFAIVRISSKRQEGNISHDTQEAEIRDYCAKNKINLERIFRMTESAKDSDHRKQYSEAIASALANDIRHILFYMYDREARNLTDNEKNEKLVRAGLICIHYVRENKVLHDRSPDSEFFIRDVQAAANKQYSRNLSVKVVDAMRRKAEQGWYPGHKPPLGYVHQRMKDEEGRELKAGTKIIADPDEKKVKQVQREFELRSIGYSYRAIREQIVLEGFVSPQRVSSYRHSIIEHRIKNPFYKGLFSWNGKEYEGKHELIIPQSVLARTQKALGGQKIMQLSGDAHGIFGGGWIRCSECGCHVVYEEKRKFNRKGELTRRFHYYHCTNGKKIHPSMAGMSVSESNLWEQFDKAVDRITIGRDLARAIADALNSTENKARDLAQKQIEDYKLAIRSIEAREDRLYDDFHSSVVDQDGFHRQTQRLRRDRHHYTRLLEQAQSAVHGRSRESTESVLELASNSKSLYLTRTPVERRIFLDLILSNPILDKINVQFYLKKPFMMLSDMNESGNWLDSLDDFRTACLLHLREGS